MIQVGKSHGILVSALLKVRPDDMSLLGNTIDMQCCGCVRTCICISVPELEAWCYFAHSHPQAWKHMTSISAPELEAWCHVAYNHQQQHVSASYQSSPVLKPHSAVLTLHYRSCVFRPLCLLFVLPCIICAAHRNLTTGGCLCLQFMILYQIVVSTAETVAFTVDGSSFSNLQV